MLFIALIFLLTIPNWSTVQQMPFPYLEIIENPILTAEDVADLDGSNVSPEASTVHEKVDMDAYGLYVGGEGHWNAFSCINVFGVTSIGALLGEFDRRFVNLDVNDQVFSPADENLANVNDCCYKVVTHFSIAAGIESTTNTCYCGEITMQIGYEFHAWHNMLEFIQFNDATAEGNLSHQENSLGLDGLFVRLSATF